MEDNESIIRTFVIKLDVPIVFITNATKEQVLNADDSYMSDEWWANLTAQALEEQGYICNYYIGEMI